MEFKSRKEIIKKLKELADKIAKEEKDKYGINVNICPMTIVEYYKSDIFKKSLSLNTNLKGKFNLMAFIVPLKYGAVSEPLNKKVAIFIKDINKIKRIDAESLFAFYISNMYHEVKHHLQQKHRKNESLNFEAFIYDIENIVQYFNEKDYLSNYDDYFVEIDANLYGVHNALEYLKKHDAISAGALTYLGKLKEECDDGLRRYDFQRIFELFHTILLEKSEIQIGDLGIWGKFFYNSDKTFKTIGQILDISNGYIDDRIIKTVFSSSEFLNNINFRELSFEHQSIILSTIKSSYDNEMSRRENILNSLNQGFINKNKWKFLDTVCSHRINRYMNYMSTFIDMMSAENRAKIFSSEFLEISDEWTI